MKRLLCNKCQMSKWCSADNNAISGWGNPNANLAIVLDAPGDVMAERLLIWILRRISIEEKDVWIDYCLKCALPRHIKLKMDDARKFHPICWQTFPRTSILSAKSVVIADNLSASLIIGRQMKDIHGRKDKASEAWVIYGFKYLLMNPAECLNTARVIWKAAEEAGLQPVDNLSLEPYKFPSRKLL